MDEIKITGERLLKLFEEIDAKFREEQRDVIDLGDPEQFFWEAYEIAKEMIAKQDGLIPDDEDED